MRIFHRIDDIEVYSDKQKKILDFFEENTQEFIVAAIPCRFSEKYSDIFRNYKNCTIYQHGYEHYNRAISGWYDEFPENMGEDEIYNMIKKGKERLEKILSCKIVGYVPPWNNTSNATMKSIDALDFEIYSAQKNNTNKYKKNKDIDIDIIESYEPKIVYKNLDCIYKGITELKDICKNVGIMYHFKDASKEDLEKIFDFIKKVELLNSK